MDIEFGGKVYGVTERKLIGIYSDTTGDEIIHEELYLTDEDEYIIRDFDNVQRVISYDEAREWTKNHCADDKIEKYFEGDD